MMSQMFFRSRLAASLVAGLVAASVVAIAPAAHAIDPVEPKRFSLSRLGVDGVMTVKPGERVTLSSQHIIDADYPKWPLAKGAVLTRTAFEVDNNTDLVFDEYEPERFWYGWSSDDDTCSFDHVGSKLTVANSFRCINYLNVSDERYVQNDSGSNETVTTNADAQVLKNGKKKLSGTGIASVFAGWVSVEDVSAYTVTAPNETDLAMDFEVCLVEEDLIAGGNLAIELDVTRDNASVDSADYNISDWQDLDGDGVEDNDFTYTVSEDGVQDDLRISFQVTFPTTLSGEYSGTLDVTRSGNSVIEECADTTTPGWPTITNDGSGGVNDPQATVDDTLSWSDSAGRFESSDWDQFDNNVDGFGGVYYWARPDTVPGSARIVNLGPTGPDTDFNGTGYLDITTDPEGYIDIGSYGAAGANFAALVQTNGSTWKLTTGSKSTAANTASVNLTKKAVVKACPADYTVSYLSVVSAPTTNLILEVHCRSGVISRQVYASVVSGKLVKLVTLGKPTKTRPCVVPSVGVNTEATGTEAAIVLYSRTSSKDGNGFCGAMDAIVSNRSITTISAAGVASATTTITDPWGGEEPGYMSIAAGDDVGEWIGTTYQPSSDMYSPSPLGTTFTLEGTTIVMGESITLDDSVDFGEWSFVQPVAKISATKWTVSIEGNTTNDGANVGRATVGTINTTTGQITNGDVVSTTDMGYFSSRLLDRMSLDSSGRATLYTVTGDAGAYSQYTATRWALPTP